MKVALLTGGQDQPYACGLLRQLLARGVDVACVGGDDLVDCRPSGPGRLEFHNLVGSTDPDRHPVAKAWGVLKYYGRLLAFAARTDARLFHILWFRKFPSLERTLLSVYFKVLGKRLVFTAHNVDDQARDASGGLVNRLSLTFLYRIVDHVLVHTDKMKRELVETFAVPDSTVTVVPFGINDVVPQTDISREAARRPLGLAPDQRVLLFFGNIAPYKGVDDLVRALAELTKDDPRFILILAGPVKNAAAEPYWRELEALIEAVGVADHVRKDVRFIPDTDVGVLFKASDVSVLPYRRVYQSGVLALSYAQGVPVVVADVGSLRDDVSEGETGFVCAPGDVTDLAAQIRAYFASGLYKDLEARRDKIRRYGETRFSWATNADLTCAVYERLQR